MNTAKTQTPYEALGGATGLRQLVHRFYQLMDTLPEAWEIRRLHPDSLAGSEDKLFMYLSGYLGGPNLFIEKFGHPQLRARHLPFSIGVTERDQWLMCMNQALAEQAADPTLREALFKALAGLADHMRNRPESED
ncbi:group II truncated hemoglobin [Denitratisoma oestradiolicum]|uniref:Group 2 truncated hemoglobin YjbI n=1 Tax=Denitratisoma oestradiolicum TaxID=311182 RepID=A0A6S6Y060_9PROT|nr:group II truncated hemoglobin [Denitratisoma oestradiolicum]TWO81366.1 globin [Denitratisoma oestradiolicum]CAB1368559.1 Group 2 truncated hemoglobin YjbI [Denitratisoma oestradiolicum]